MIGNAAENSAAIPFAYLVAQGTTRKNTSSIVTVSRLDVPGV